MRHLLPLLSIIFYCSFLYNYGHLAANASSERPAITNSSSSTSSISIPSSVSTSSVSTSSATASLLSAYSCDNPSPGRWLECNPSEIKEEFKDLTFEKDKNGYGVRAKYVFIPTNLDWKKISLLRPLVIFNIHGTWAYDSPTHYDPHSTYFGSILEFARQQAEIRKLPVQVISFRWAQKTKKNSGLLKKMAQTISHNTSYIRKEGGVVLATLFLYYSNYEKITIAHSHGCNVVNYASKLLGNKTYLDHIINIASPIRDTTEPDFAPENFIRLTNFYSNGDWIATLGAINDSDLPHWLTAIGSIHKYSGNEFQKITNVRVQLDGKEPGHKEIKNLVGMLTQILEELNYFQINNDLDLNIDKSSSPNGLQVSIRHLNQVTVENAISSRYLPEQLKKELINSYRQELNRSELNEKMFIKKYGRSIHNKVGFIQHLLSVFNL